MYQAVQTLRSYVDDVDDLCIVTYVDDDIINLNRIYYV